MNPLEDGSEYISAALSLFNANLAGATCAALARERGLPAYKVRHLVRIARKLDADTVAFCRRNPRLSYGHARVLAGLNMPSQIDAARTTVAKGWSVRQLEQYARGESEVADSSYYERLSESLSEQLGRPLSIVPDKDSPTAGTLSFRYFSADDFETVCLQIGLSFDEY